MRLLGCAQGPLRLPPAGLLTHYRRGRQDLAFFEERFLVKTSKSDLAVPYSAIRHLVVRLLAGGGGGWVSGVLVGARQGWAVASCSIVEGSEHLTNVATVSLAGPSELSLSYKVHAPWLTGIVSYHTARWHAMARCIHRAFGLTGSCIVHYNE